MYRVTWFSAFSKPQHFENLDEQEKDETVADGKAQQYKVVVTMMDGDPPIDF